MDLKIWLSILALLAFFGSQWARNKRAERLGEERYKSDAASKRIEEVRKAKQAADAVDNLSDDELAELRDKYSKPER